LTERKAPADAGVFRVRWRQAAIRPLPRPWGCRSGRSRAYEQTLTDQQVRERTVMPT